MTYIEARKEIARWQHLRRWENATGYSGDFTMRAGWIWGLIVEVMEEKKLEDWTPALRAYEKALDKIAYGAADA